MNTLIIYFSQTGNTKKIAGYIGEGIRQMTGQCDLLEMNETNSGMISKYDLIGIGCPVFYYKEPFHVRDFIESLSELKGQYWFAFCTHGSVIGNFFPSMAALLQDKGATVIGYFHSYACIRVPYLPSPGLTEGHPDTADLAEAKRFGSQIIRFSDVTSRTVDGKLPVPGPVSSPEWIAEGARFSLDFLEKNMPRLRLNEENCTRCGTCEDECPVDGIDLEEAPPRLQDPCIYCLNCVCRCPESAIEADWKRLIDYAPEYFARCRKELDREVKRGNFRWLIDPDGVDTSAAFILKK